MSLIRVSPSIAVALSLATPLAAQQLPQVRQIGAVTATSSENFLSPVVGVRALPGGKVLVHDQTGRRVVLLDAALTNPQVIADSTPATGNAYSGRIAGLLPYKGDSSLFVDPQSLSMLVIDPEGKVGRVMSVPRSQDALALVGLQGNPGVDAAGRLVYRAAPQPRFSGGPPGAGGMPGVPDIPDSAAIQRIDLATRVVDTVGWIKTPKIKMNIVRTENSVSVTSEVNPLPVVDDWTVLSDGTIAFVRGRDYHLDFVDPDGGRRAAAKVPFEWQRLTDEQKVSFLDSVKVARERQMAEARANAPVGATGSAPVLSGEGGFRMEIRGGGPPGGAPGGRPGEARVVTAPGGGMGSNLNFVPASELPDYRPAFFQGQVRADLEGRVWVRTTNYKDGGSIYDVIDRTGVLVDRVALPPGRAIAAFGPEGAVYLVSRSGTQTVVEKASVK